LMAIAEGGLFGKGPGYGDLIEIAAADTDIVFSTICEEWGFLVALLVIFFIVSLLILPMINKPRSYYHTTMVLGVAAVFVVQMALNIFGSCNLIPFTGVTIPFISQGGSSMITCGLLAGMLKAGQSPVFRKPDVVTENTLSFKVPFRKEEQSEASQKSENSNTMPQNPISSNRNANRPNSQNRPPQRPVDPNRNANNSINPNPMPHRSVNPNRNLNRSINSNGMSQRSTNRNENVHESMNPNSVTPQKQTYYRNPYQRLYQPHQNQNKTEQGGNHYEKY
ncbi:MAG: FtsW/RodA/SpoVE family cell cycle protein, partial [Ruminococcus sp.]